MTKVGDAIVSIGAERVPIEVFVNNDGNLVLVGIGTVFYDLWGEELILRRERES